MLVSILGFARLIYNFRYRWRDAIVAMICAIMPCAALFLSPQPAIAAMLLIIPTVWVGYVLTRSGEFGDFLQPASARRSPRRMAGAPIDRSV
jgi:hypothetical protein